MKHSIWVEIFFADKYIKYFYRAETLKELELTPTEYLVLLFLAQVDRKMSFYEIKKIIPIEPKQLHLIIKKLVRQNYIKRLFIDRSSSIWVTPQIKKTLFKFLDENYDILNEFFDNNKSRELFMLLKEFNDSCRVALDRRHIAYKQQK